MRGGPDYITPVVAAAPVEQTIADVMRGRRGGLQPATVPPLLGVDAGTKVEPTVAAPSGPPTVFEVPVELVLYATNATGQMFLRRWAQKGATFLKTARVWRVNERLVAEVAFAAPVCPENQTGCVVHLSVSLWENLA